MLTGKFGYTVERAMLAGKFCYTVERACGILAIWLHSGTGMRDPSRLKVVRDVNRNIGSQSYGRLTRKLVRSQDLIQRDGLCCQVFPLVVTQQAR